MCACGASASAGPAGAPGAERGGITTRGRAVGERFGASASGESMSAEARRGTEGKPPRSGVRRQPLCVTHDHSVSVRRQIAAGLACSILDGLRAPGEALPSTRELAHGLGVHRNTVAAAYRALRARGLLTDAVGTPPRVIRTRLSGGRLAHPALERESPDAIRLLRELATRAFEAGVPRAELTARLEGWWAESEPRELVLIEPRSGLRAVLGAELRTRAHPWVVECDWRAIRLGSAETDRAVVVGRPEIARRTEERLPGVAEIFPLVLVGGSAALARARRVRLPGVVALLTRSAEIRGFARDVAAGHHASGLSLATPDPTDPAAVGRAARIARLILVDASCWSMSFETRAPIRMLRIVSDGTVRALRRYLGG